jgi:hypothetical protein
MTPTMIDVLFSAVWLFGAFVTEFDKNPWPHPANIICLVTGLVFIGAALGLS